MYKYLRNILFWLDPETAHELSLDLMGASERLRLLPLFTQKVPSNPVTVMGLTFDNPVGLAAGLDKNGDYFNALGQLGFGFVEIGTVTPKAQPGNPKPRMFRLPEAEAIINRMGFNNKGVDHLVNNVKRRRYDGVLGINIGKNKVTAEENALDDYQVAMRKVYAYADYITINISSPNTPGLRNLQFGENLKTLLGGLKETQKLLAEQHQRYVPLAVKIAPDMTDEELQGVANTINSVGMDGVIATNTTVSRDAVKGFEHGDEAGGLSGAPLTDASTETIRSLRLHLDKNIPIIGVGGIMCAEDAAEKIEAGASLVQIYSGFIYEGPGLINAAADAIAALCSQQKKRA